jgi:hypothetical protein
VGDWRRRGGIAAARGSVDGGGSNPSGARARGKTGEVVAAEEERDRTAGAKKRWGGLGVRVDRATASVPPADSMRVDLIQARRPSRRKRGSGAGQGSGLGCGARARGVRQSGPRAVAERPAGEEEKQRRGRALEEGGEGKGGADARGHMARERKGKRRTARSGWEKAPTSGAQLAEGGRKRGEGARAGLHRGSWASAAHAGKGRKGKGRVGPAWREERGEENGPAQRVCFSFSSFLFSSLHSNHPNKSI